MVIWLHLTAVWLPVDKRPYKIFHEILHREHIRHLKQQIAGIFRVFCEELIIKSLSMFSSSIILNARSKNSGRTMKFTATSSLFAGNYLMAAILI